jgi:molybdopterin-guanine dinucleotide biosynthesis protein A
MLQRVCRILGEVVQPIVVVAARDQPLPPLSDDVLVAADEFESLGPLAGIATGLAALRERAEIAFVTSCDVPLLKPAFVQAMIDRLGEHDVAVPSEAQYDHVLSGVYRTSLEDEARRLLAADRRRPVFLLETSRSLRVPIEDLRAVDPQLDSLKNTNTPDDYFAALRLAGLEVPSTWPPSESDE